MSASRTSVDRDSEGRTFMDVTAPEHLSISISEDGKTVWINSEDSCILRVCRIGILVVEDRRPAEAV